MANQDRASADAVLARIESSSARRYFALAVLVTLGGILLSITLSRSGGSVIWQGAMLVAAGAVIWVAVALYRATAMAIELTETGMRCSDGTLLAALGDIRHVERGSFAFKPSNGFLLKLDRGGPMVWRPGLFWRIGRRVGVGGVAHAGQTKKMAEVLALLLAERAAG